MKWVYCMQACICSLLCLALAIATSVDARAAFNGRKIGEGLSLAGFSVFLFVFMCMSIYSARQIAVHGPDFAKRRR